MSGVESWLANKIEACAPPGTMSASYGQLASACAVLGGKGGSLIFGMASETVPPNDALYRRACAVLAAWFEHLDDEAGAKIATFVHKAGLDVPVPERFATDAVDKPPPAPDPERIATMRKRVGAASPLFGQTEWDGLQAGGESWPSGSARGAVWCVSHRGSPRRWMPKGSRLLRRTSACPCRSRFSGWLSTRVPST